ncbi:MAG TPA: BREX system Lon protease-like protein BrxL [Methanothermococcus okinawensis]|uniref:BREX system Lon protease-like protein BrxL n=1 Tax=Methanothermococcus okinawensis TaxID=155863 RepID=A0A833DS43_9EURY|nr:BREX system Lon protease-like protein BrxL [Methanothermococcus okinawensis]
MSRLDEKIKRVFPEESVHKCPKEYEIFSGYSLPSFVKDWIFRKFTDEYGNIDKDALKLFLDTYIAHKGSKIKGDLINDLKEITLLARIEIEPDIKQGILRFSIPDIGIKLNEGWIPPHIARKYPELKGGEVWGVVKLAYIPPEKTRMGVIEIVDYKPFKPYEVDIEYFREKRKEFTLEEWIDLLIRSMEYNPEGFQSLSQKLLFLARLLVFVEPNLNMIELAPKGTGKSYTFNNLSKYGWVMSGGTVSRAKLLYDMSRSTPGIITRYDFVTLDEIENIKFTDVNELRGALKNYLESGYFSIGNYRGVSSSGFMLLGNIPLSKDKRPVNKKYFANLPNFFQDSALLDRFHGFIEGWKLPRMREDLKLRGYALNVEYFSEVLHNLRKIPDFNGIVGSILDMPKNADTRDTKAILRICTAYLKLLFPHVSEERDIDKKDFETYCLKPAINMRRIIKEQISLIDSEFSNTLPDIKVR